MIAARRDRRRRRRRGARGGDPRGDRAAAGAYRVPVVLCDLEGRTHEQAARHLGCPVGTVKSRLARGRHALRDRLTRRGLADRCRHAAGGPRAGPPRTRGLDDRSRRPIPFDPGGPPGDRRVTCPGVLTIHGHDPLVESWLRSCSRCAPRRPASSRSREDPSAVAEARRRGCPRGRTSGTACDSPWSSRASFSVVVEERGRLEVSQNADVFCQVESRRRRSSPCLPEGTRVSRGQLVCELDSASLKDRLDQPGGRRQEGRGRLSRPPGSLGKSPRSRCRSCQGVYPRSCSGARARSTWPSRRWPAPRNG